jgi:hypothetical protein
VVSGVKDVENRSYATQYRGRLYIHSSGHAGYYPDPIAEGPERLPVGYEYWRMAGLDRKAPLQEGQYWLRDGEKLVCKKNHFPDEIEREFHMWDRLFRFYPSGGLSQAIVGAVDLVDVVQDSKSKWAEKDSYHWILENAECFDKPITGIMGKLRMFQIEI